MAPLPTCATDKRPWETVKVPLRDAHDNIIEGATRDVVVAHADLALMRTTGRDTRWPRGTAMNGIPQGTSDSNGRSKAETAGMTGYTTRPR